MKPGLTNEEIKEIQELFIKANLQQFLAIVQMESKRRGLNLTLQ